ncbi:MAG: hypothetical protein JW384_00459 [Nitrosomonadaceae bacterium]|nr:hypothetical protein [Nitrosomonadaceae bacterium]
MHRPIAARWARKKGGQPRQGSLFSAGRGHRKGTRRVRARLEVSVKSGEEASSPDCSTQGGCSGRRSRTPARPLGGALAGAGAEGYSAPKQMMRRWVGEGVEVEPDWDLAAQPVPDYEIDKRVNEGCVTMTGYRRHKAAIGFSFLDNPIRGVR